MQTNRDISILLLKAQDKALKCLDLMGASGARGIRIALEVQKAKVTINDANPHAVRLIKENARKNTVKIIVSHASANRFLRESKEKWDYIDIDPFGTPAPFIENAIKKLSNNGIVGVTATDTSALCGTYPSACIRKYMATSLKCPIMHELAIRILIAYIQRIAGKLDIHLKPIFSQSTDHYIRVYLKRISKPVEKPGYLAYNFKTGEFKTRKTKPLKDYAGPLWVGDLWDKRLVTKMFDISTNTKAYKELDNPNYLLKLKKMEVADGTIKLMKSIYDESKADVVGFYDIHALAKIYTLSQLPKRDDIIQKLIDKGYAAVRTHFTPTGIRTNGKLKDVLTVCYKYQAVR